MKTLRFIPFVLLFVNSISPITGQNDHLEEAELEFSPLKVFDIGLDLGFPGGKFNENTSFVMKGISVAGLIEIKENFYVGVEGQYYHLDRRAVEVDDIVQGISVIINESTNTHNTALNLLFRFFPDITLPVIDIYGEAVLGYKIFYGTTNESFFLDEEISTTNFHDFDGSMQYGLNLGSVITLTSELMLNLKLGYQLCGVSDYIAEDENIQNVTFSRDAFINRRSSTDYYRTSLLISWSF